jgi:hypothetical protein
VDFHFCGFGEVSSPYLSCSLVCILFRGIEVHITVTNLVDFAKLTLSEYVVSDGLRRVYLVEKLMVAQLVKKFIAFMKSEFSLPG